MYTLGTLVKATNILLLHIVAVETSCTNQINVKQLKILVIIKCYTIHGSFISSFGTHVQYHIRRSTIMYHFNIYLLEIKYFINFVFIMKTIPKTYIILI